MYRVGISPAETFAPSLFFLASQCGPEGAEGRKARTYLHVSGEGKRARSAPTASASAKRKGRRGLRPHRRKQALRKRPRRGRHQEDQESWPSGGATAPHYPKASRQGARARGRYAATTGSNRRQASMRLTLVQSLSADHVGTALLPASFPPLPHPAAALTGSETVAGFEPPRHGGRARPPSGVIPPPLGPSHPTAVALRCPA